MYRIKAFCPTHFNSNMKRNQDLKAKLKEQRKIAQIDTRNSIITCQ